MSAAGRLDGNVDGSGSALLALERELGLATARDGIGADRLVAVAQALLAKNRQLEHALQSRVVIEQAKGVLAERFALPLDDAFDVLRKAARANRVRIHALAADVVASVTTPAELQPYLRPRKSATSTGAD